MLNRKPLTSTIAVPLIIGILALVNLMQRPRFAAFHNVDVLQLLGSGMCFGVALAGLFSLVRGMRSS